MNDSPSPSLVANVQELIVQIFDVSEQEAHEQAFGLVLLAEEWGDPETARHLDWANQVKKRLGDKVKWRSETEREKFTRDRQQNYDAYEEQIQLAKRRRA